MSTLELMMAHQNGGPVAVLHPATWLRAAKVTGAEMLAMAKGARVRAVVYGQLVELSFRDRRVVS